MTLSPACFAGVWMHPKSDRGTLILGRMLHRGQLGRPCAEGFAVEGERWALMQAMAKIKEQRGIAADARKKSADLKAGMDIFSIPHPPYRELGTMEADVEKLQGIWSIVCEWEDSYSTWKTGKFKEIKVLMVQN